MISNDYYDTMCKLCKLAVDLGESPQIKSPMETSITDIICMAYAAPELEKSDEICAICGTSTAPLQEFMEWVECEHCKRWQHLVCDGIYNAEALTNQQIQYLCPYCRAATCAPHPCNQFEVLARDPKAPIVEEKASKQKTGRPKKLPSQSASGPGHARAELSEDSAAPGAKTVEPGFVEESNQPNLRQLAKFTSDELQTVRLSILEKEQPLLDLKRRQLGGEANPHNLFAQSNAIMNAARLPASKLYLQLQNSYKEAHPVQDLNLQTDDIQNFNLLAVMIRQHLDTTDPYRGLTTPRLPGRRKDTMEQDHERRHQFMTSQQLSIRGGKEVLNLREQLQILPIIPDDSDLRVRTALSQFDCALENVERLRFRYLRTLVGEAARGVVVYREMALKQEPSAASQNLSVFQSLALKFTHDVDWQKVQLDQTSYLRAEELLQSGLTNSSFEILNQRQAFDLRSRGIELFQGLGILRASLLNAIVNVNLGMNIFDKHFGEQLTDHIIRYGVSSARNYVIQQSVSNYQASALDSGVLYEEPSYRFDGFIGQPLCIQNDDQIQDWDILETPSSVLWVLKVVQQILQQYAEI